jgi:hypothetical protein
LPKKVASNRQQLITLREGAGFLRSLVVCHGSKPLDQFLRNSNNQLTKSQGASF